jgi:phage-related minor tail protein
MEKKKEMIQRKAFEQKKKMDIAQAVISTALGAARSMEMGGIIGPVLAAMTIAMGMAQIAIIKKQTFQGSSGAGAAKPSTISVGKRDNKVDTAQGASSGELSYLRGSKGIGSNANNFAPGGAGGMKKGYAAGGEILVGERGPELISPTQGGYQVTPNDKIGSGTSNVNFTINAVDAAGVQELLSAQRGNIIGMIREAANEHGEEFMESVNTEAY